jgi:hypothetical protein
MTPYQAKVGDYEGQVVAEFINPHTQQRMAVFVFNGGALTNIYPINRIDKNSCHKKYHIRRDLYDIHHTDDLAVIRFALSMRDKLELSRERGRHGWETSDNDYLNECLYGHLDKGDPVDVANFCMMIHQRGGKIEKP